MVVLVSRSRDGELQTSALASLGLTVVRGSPSREGSAGLRALVRRLRAGLDAAFAVDGSCGPYGVVKPGVVLAASLAGAVIVPLTFVTDRAWVASRAWDRFVLPWPFARVLLLAGDPVDPAGARGEALERVRSNLERSLHALGERARQEGLRTWGRAW
jgi:lysophospholipid acyltransferase (LPLAT)-like uncharacterized protein